jgi:cytidylate kinase
MVIAIDGPAGSGKGTLARKLAAHFSMFHLDSGKLYRLVAVRAEERHVDLQNPDEIKSLFDNLKLEELENPRLSAHSVGTLAAKYSSDPMVRRCITGFIRQVAARIQSGIVVDGRDIGTVVLPDAAVKIFVTADIAERARRRLHEVNSTGQSASFNDILVDLGNRDRADIERKVAPLVRAPDAYLLDTTELDVEGAFRVAAALVERTKLQATSSR